MRAAVINAIGAPFTVEEVEIASPIDREVMIDVRAAGLCQSDLAIATQGRGYEMPIVLGHEVAGVVSRTGPAVTQFSVGDHIVGCLLQSCGTCGVCMAGRPHHCPHPEATRRRAGQEARLRRGDEPVAQLFGLGGFAEQAVVHENQLVKVPDSVPFPQAALIGCGVMTGVGAVLNTADVQAGDTVVVLGSGGVGLNVVSGARIAGAASIIVVDIVDSKLEVAKRFGATHTVNSRLVDPIGAVRDIIGGGCDHVFDVVGLEEVAAQGLEMLGVGGGLYLIGIAGSDVNLPLGIAGSIHRQIRVQGVYLGSSNFKRDVPYYAELYLQGRLNLDDLVSRQIGLDEIDAGYASLRDPQHIRAVITKF